MSSSALGIWKKKERNEEIIKSMIFTIWGKDWLREGQNELYVQNNIEVWNKEVKERVVITKHKQKNIGMDEIETIKFKQ